MPDPSQPAVARHSVAPAAPLTPNTRLDALGAYPFTRLAQLLEGVTPAANVPPLAMSVGEPQHEPPALLAETIARHANLWNRYPPGAGTDEMREAAAGWLTRRYALPDGFLDPSAHLLSLAGTKEGLFLAGLAAVPDGRGAAVLMPNPFYLVYEGAAAMAGAELVHLPATAATGFLPDLDAIDEAVWARAALFFLCTPGNPQGAVASPAYLDRALALARRHGVVLCVDECYSEVWDRAPPSGALEAAHRSGSLANLLVFHSLSKRSSAAGLRAGICAGDPDLIARFLRLRSYGGAQVPLPIQAAAAALWRDEAHVEENRARYRAKLDVAEAILGRRFGFYRPPGGFFLWLDVGDGERATERLWREAAIRVLPGAYVARAGADGINPGAAYIRVALVHDEATVAAALERMTRVL